MAGGRGRTHRSGDEHKKNQEARKRHKLPCRTVPATPTGLTLNFSVQNVKHKKEWRARAAWTPVTADANGRAVQIDRYEAQIRATDASGVPINAGNGDELKRETVNGDDDTHATWHDIPKPGINYYQARVRARHAHRGIACWSAWTTWTTATQPVSGDPAGPATPTGLALTFDRVEGTQVNPWRAKVKWNEIPTYTPTDGEPLNGVHHYSVQLRASNDGGVTIANSRFMQIPAEVTDSTKQAEFSNIVRQRHYQARVRATDLMGHHGAWTNFSSWVRPSAAAPDAVTNVNVNVTQQMVRVSWNEPANKTDVWRYRVQIIRSASGNVVDDGVTSSNRYFYNIPQSQRGDNHRAKVTVIQPYYSLQTEQAGSTVVWTTGTESAEAETVDVGNTDVWTADEVDIPGIAAEVAPLVTSDGLVPGTANTPTVQGGVGFLAVKWTPITNADPVIYEVHVSTTTGFTPGAGTKAGETPGSMFFIKTLPDGTALDYYVDPDADPLVRRKYYVKLLAKDDDGVAAAYSAQGQGQLVEVNSPDIAVNAITADNILASTITGDKFASMVAITSRLIAGAENGEHVEVNDQGLKVLRPDPDTPGEFLTVVDLPVTGDPTFNGKVVAQSLEVIGGTYLGATTFAPASTTTLVSTVGAPQGAPDSSVNYPAGITFNTSGVTDSKPWFTLAYSATGGAGGATACFYTAHPGGGGSYWRYIREYDATTGAYIRSFELPDGTDDIWGLVAVGTKLYVLHQRWSTGAYFIRKYSLAGFTQDSVNTVVPNTDKPGLGYDGTNIYMVSGAGHTSGTGLRLEAFDPTTMAVGTAVNHTGITFDCREGGGGQTTEFSGFVKVGSTFYLSVYSYDGANVVKRGVYALTGTPTTTNGLTRNLDEDFKGANGAEADGLAHDGTQFWSVLDGGNITKHTNWTWTSADSSVYYVGYTWRDTTGSGEGTAAGQKHEGLISPRRVITHRKRAGLTVSTSPLPGAGGADDPTGRRIYINRGASEPQASGRFDGRLQGTITGSQITVTSFASGGAQNPATGTFPGGTPAILTTQGSKFSIDGNDAFTFPFYGCKVGKSTTQTIPVTTVTAVAFGDADTIDTFNMHDPASNNSRFTIPKAGKYRVHLQMEIDTADAGSPTRRLDVIYRKNGVATNLYFNRNPFPVMTGGTHVHGDTILDLAASDYIEVYLQSLDENVVIGGALIQSFIEIEYRGL